MQVLFQAIENEYSNNAALVAALTHGLHREKAPEGTQMPYGVIRNVNKSPFPTFTEDSEDFIVQFDIYDNDSKWSVIDNIVDKLETCFDDCVLTVTGYTCIHMTRGPGFPMIEDGMYRYSVRYTCLIEKN